MLRESPFIKILFKKIYSTPFPGEKKLKNLDTMAFTKKLNLLFLLPKK